MSLFEIGILVIAGVAVGAFFLKRSGSDAPPAIGGVIHVNEMLIQSLIHNNDETLKRVEQSVEVLDLTVARLIKTVDDQNRIYNTEQFRMREMLNDDLLEDGE